jgi:hypothetical protein
MEADQDEWSLSPKEGYDQYSSYSQSSSYNSNYGSTYGSNYTLNHDSRSSRFSNMDNYGEVEEESGTFSCGYMFVCR